MRALMIRTAVLSALVGAALVGGCGSSDDASGGGGSAGMAGGAGDHGGAAGGGAGSSNGGSGAVNGGTSGSSAAGADNTTAGADNSSAGTSDSSAGASNSAAGEGGADQGPQACNALLFSGAAVTLMHSSAAPPTLQNGTLVAGDYRLTDGGVYDSGAGVVEVGALAQVSVVGSTATIQLVDNWGMTSTLVIVMGQPSSVPPSSVKLTCDTDPKYKSSVGVEASAGIKYGVAGNTFSLYEAPLKLVLVFTLQP